MTKIKGIKIFNKDKKCHFKSFHSLLKINSYGKSVKETSKLLNVCKRSVIRIRSFYQVKLDTTGPETRGRKRILDLFTPRRHLE